MATLSYSRHQYAELVFDQKVPTWLALHRRAFASFGGVPKRVVPDNLKAAVIRVNSQSGKGGVAFVMERDHGLSLPRWMQVELAEALVEQAQHRALAGAGITLDEGKTAFADQRGVLVEGFLEGTPGGLDRRAVDGDGVCVGPAVVDDLQP